MASRVRGPVDLCTRNDRQREKYRFRICLFLIQRIKSNDSKQQQFSAVLNICSVNFPSRPCTLEYKSTSTLNLDPGSCFARVKNSAANKRSHAQWQKYGNASPLHDWQERSTGEFSSTDYNHFFNQLLLCTGSGSLLYWNWGNEIVWLDFEWKAWLQHCSQSLQ